MQGRLLLALLALSTAATAQVMDGQLRVKVHDPSGRAVRARVELAGRNPPFFAEALADAEGEGVLRRLPPGVYQLRVAHNEFADFTRTVEIRSSVPQTIDVALQLGVVQSEITVRDAAPLLDPAQSSIVMHAGRSQLEQALGTTLGRSTIDVVTAMPGWLLEANAVLHPRGSEYDTQYVIDGMPLYDNRSIAFAPAFESSEFEGVNVLTAGLPAEYGRRLGGVIALDTRRVGFLGHRSEADFQGGSYDTYIGSFSHQYGNETTAVSLGVLGGHTSRYLDPPSLEGITKASSSRLYARLGQDLGDRDRLSFYFRTNRTGFLVPNDLVQQAAGQRQDRRTEETAGQIHYQHTFSSRALGSLRGMVRDLTSELWSNEFSTPVYVQQDRGFREGALMGDITLENKHHTLKFGGDLRVNSIREQFLLAEPDELPDIDLDFRDSRRSTEVGLFVQDLFRFGNFAANLGVRFDRYDLLIEDNAVSPRVALSYYVRPADLLLRASYDRIFQPPPLENLLLSSGAGLDLDDVEDAIPVPASRAHFFEVGLRKPIGNAVRLDVSHYWRTFHNYIDDDVFLNTGISFPITFETARIEGTEVRFELPRWRGLSSFLSYSNMLGRASSPVTGGLFIEGGEAEELRDVVEHFAISQDQRNTVAAQIRFEPHPRVWFSIGARYGSGLPVELERDDDDDHDEMGEEPPGQEEPGDEDDGDDDEGDADDGDDDDGGDGGSLQPIPQAILDKVNFERGRVRPNFSLDFSVGLRVWERDARSLTVQFDLRNATDRLNVINFSGLFSGTALAPGRQATVQMKLRF